MALASVLQAARKDSPLTPAQEHEAGLANAPTAPTGGDPLSLVKTPKAWDLYLQDVCSCKDKVPICGGDGGCPDDKETKGSVCGDETKQAAKPYYRDWNRTQFHKGKQFIAPTRIFRADKSLYFPNMVGSTLASPSKSSDTTAVLRDRISIVSVYSNRWAETQTQTFTSESKNPIIEEMLREDRSRNGGTPLLQKVGINIEQNWIKALIVRAFMGSVRRQREKEDWGRYFLVRRGVTEEMREALGMANSMVGYTYLVDWECRIRWAGSAEAERGEGDGLVAGLRRLVESRRSEGVDTVKGIGEKGALKLKR
ncbi:MAG: hypothetical protein Q9186_006946 [Xanthomendoza sp. 1 TL-2023]